MSIATLRREIRDYFRENFVEELRGILVEDGYFDFELVSEAVLTAKCFQLLEEQWRCIGIEINKTLKNKRANIIISLPTALEIQAPESLDRSQMSDGRSTKIIVDIKPYYSEGSRITEEKIQNDIDKMALFLDEGVDFGFVLCPYISDEIQEDFLDQEVLYNRENPKHKMFIRSF